MSKPAKVSLPEKRKHIARKMRENLVDCMTALDPGYEPAEVHNFVAGKIQEIMNGELLDEEGNVVKRLILNMPPRHGKSEIVTRGLPLWLLGNDPSKEIVVGSYNTTLPAKASKHVRRTVRDNKLYQKVFPDTKLQKGETNAYHWATTKGGSYQATGTTSSLTGHGADLLIVDDPVKDRAEAESEKIRENIWDWFMSTALTRLSPDGVVVIIMTRWHQDDLVGRLQEPARIKELEESGFGDENYYFIKLPGLSHGEDVDPMGREEGESLWPERWPERAIAARRVVMGSYEFNALYDQEPGDKGGNYADVSKIRYCTPEDVPRRVEQPRCWDLAVTKHTLSDYNAGAKGGYDKKTGNFYITNMNRKKSKWAETSLRIKSLARKEKNRIRIEAQGAFYSLFEILRDELMGKNDVSYKQPSTAKLTRALPWFAAMEAGQVYFVKDGEDDDWIKDCLDEIKAFPHGVHDDQVDAITLLWEMTAGKQVHTILE